MPKYICPHLKLARARYYENKREESFVARNVIQSMKDWPKVCMQGHFGRWTFLPPRKKLSRFAGKYANRSKGNNSTRVLLAMTKTMLNTICCHWPCKGMSDTQLWKDPWKMAMEVNTHTPAPKNNYSSLCIFHKVHKGFMKGWNCLTYKLKGPVWKVKKEDEEQSNIVLTNSCYGGFTLAKCFYMMPSKLKPI